MTDKRREELKEKINSQIDALSTDDLEAVAGGGIYDFLQNMFVWECSACGRTFTNSLVPADHICTDCGGTLEKTIPFVKPEK